MCQALGVGQDRFTAPTRIVALRQLGMVASVHADSFRHHVWLDVARPGARGEQVAGLL